MVNIRCVALSHHGDDVKAYTESDAHPLHIGVGGENKVAHLAPVNGFLRFGQVRAVTGLHLYDSKGLPILCDGCDVEVAPTCAPVAVQDAVTFLLKVFGGFLLAPSSVVIVGGHIGVEI